MSDLMATAQRMPYPDGIAYHDDGCLTCARCGSRVEWRACAACCDDPDRSERCADCAREGGAWHCTAPRDYCHTYPLPGRADVQRPQGD